MARTAEIYRHQPARGITKIILVLVTVMSNLLVNVTAQAAQGDLININFGFTYNGLGAAGRLVSDPSSTQIWNNITDAQIKVGDDPPFTSQTLVNSQGNATHGATLTWNADHFNTLNDTHNGFAGTVYKTLMRNYISTDGGNFTLSFSGLDAGTYQLYVYTQGDKKGADGQTLNLSINGVNTTALPSVGTSYEFIPGQNYLTATLTTDSSGHVSFDYSGLGNMAGINGMQLFQTSAAPVPEPASMVLIGVGGLLAAFRRFSKSAA